MKYMGSKDRIAKHILPIMLAEAEKNGITKWVEPFVGGANMLDKVPDTFVREGYDINKYLIALLKALANGWNPPEYVSKEQYAFVRDNRDIDAILTGWCGINLSYSGKWFGGYADKVETKDSKIRDYQAEAIVNVKKQAENIKGVCFSHKSYGELSFENCLIYCDPPYKATSDYKTGCFDHEHFFQWCRDMSTKGNVVFVSEYEAPDDFECVWQMEVASSLSANGKQGGNKRSIERLFTLP